MDGIHSHIVWHGACALLQKSKDSNAGCETVITCNSPKINHLYTRYLQTIAAKEDRSGNR